MWHRSWRWAAGGGGWTAAGFEMLRFRLNRWLASWLFQCAGLRADSRVLEGGSGPGQASSLLAKRLPQGLSVALDLDADALGQLRARDGSLPAVQADLRRLPFADGRFDLVWNSSTLEHLPEPAHIVQEMTRVTKLGGAVFIGVPYRYGPLGFQPLIRRSRFGQWLGPVFNRQELLAVLASCGLEPLQVRTYAYRCFLGVMARKTFRPLGAQTAGRDAGRQPAALSS